MSSQAKLSVKIPVLCFRYIEEIPDYIGMYRIVQAHDVRFKIRELTKIGKEDPILVPSDILDRRISMNLNRSYRCDWTQEMIDTSIIIQAENDYLQQLEADNEDN